MPRRHRPYVPKAKGCFECSKRRIHCDRTEPQCRKCDSKGIKCSGLGVRHRFSDGAASRGAWVGKSIQQVYAECEDDAARQGKSQAIVTSGSQEDVTAKPCEGVESDDREDVSPCSSVPQKHGHDLRHLAKCSPTLLQPAPSNVPVWARFLLLHYSECIATEMVAIDGLHNGWRHLVLPMAHSDSLVLDAVLAVSSFHLSVTSLNRGQTQTSPSGSTRNPPWPAEQTHLGYQTNMKHPEPNHLYARAIRGLQQRKDLRSSDPSTIRTILLTILILLAAIAVSGSDDFPIMFRALQSALATVGGESALGNGELDDFMMRQIHKLTVYAAPWLSEKNGVQTLSSDSHVTGYYNCLYHCSQRQPGHADAVSTIASLFRQARAIYLDQASRSCGMDTSLLLSPPAPAQDAALSLLRHDQAGVEPAVVASVARVQRFKETLEAYPAGAPGKQVLIWSTFVAASDCILDEHKAFFEGVLGRYYARSGFMNIPRALCSLHEIWARRAHGDRWTSMLPLLVKVFVM